MNFAYVQGQEEVALAYFESRLTTTFDLQERQKLSEMVKGLKKQLRQQGKKLPPKAAVMLELSGASNQAGL